MGWIPESQPPLEWSQMRSKLMMATNGSSQVRQVTYMVSLSRQAQSVFSGWNCETISFVVALCYLCYIYWERIRFAVQV